MKKIILNISGVFGLVGVILLAIVLISPNERVEANVALGGEYGGVGSGYSTTTSPLYNNPDKVSLIRNGRGAFGSVTVLEAGSSGGDFEFYDATTTNISLRRSDLATSSIFIGSIPNNATVGNYNFDVTLNYGLVMVWTGSSVATTTITVR